MNLYNYAVESGNFTCYQSDGITVYYSIPLFYPIFLINPESIAFSEDNYTIFRLSYNSFNQLKLADGTILTKSNFSNANELFIQISSLFDFASSGGGGGNLLGNWNALTNTPTLADGVGNVGDYYVVTVSGTQNLGSGSQTFAINDTVRYSQANIWLKVSPGSAPVWGLITGNPDDQIDLQQGTIQGVFTPSNTSIIQNDTFKTAFQKAQGQINVKSNSPTSNGNTYYVNYYIGSNITGNGRYDKPYASLTYSLSQISTSDIIIYVGVNTGIATENINITGTINNVRIVGVGDDLLVNANSGLGLTRFGALTINSPGSRIEFVNIQFDSINIQAGEVIFNNCNIRTSITALANDNVIIFQRVNYSAVSNISLQNNSPAATANFYIDPTSLGAFIVSDNTNSQWNIINALAYYNNSGLLSDINFNKLTYVTTINKIQALNNPNPETIITYNNTNNRFEFQIPPKFIVNDIIPQSGTTPTMTDSNVVIFLPDLENDPSKSSFDYDGDSWRISLQDSSFIDTITIKVSPNQPGINIIDSDGSVITNADTYTISRNVEATFRWSDYNPDPNNRTNPVQWEIQ